MDILIKNMEMPKSCGNCKFSQFHEANPWTTWYTCLFSNKDIDDTGNGRLVGCPLIPVPEHGDLIDKQKLIKELEKAWNVDDDQDFCNKSVWRIIEREAEVVLERTT